MAGRVTAIIPARLESRRFPRKVLYPYHGKPLLYYVWNEISGIRKIDSLFIATDSNEVENTALSFGAKVVRTSGKHRTGTDRIAEAVKKVGGDIIINIQADNFGLKARTLSRIIGKIKDDKSIRYATMASPITTDKELFNPNVVKLVMSKDGHALWFSRFPIPYIRDVGKQKHSRQFPFLSHIGIYFFRRKALTEFGNWPRSTLEKTESLEQLRILENNRKIRVFKTMDTIVAVDTSQDLKNLKYLYRS